MCETIDPEPRLLDLEPKQLSSKLVHVLEKISSIRFSVQNGLTGISPELIARQVVS